MGYKTCTHDDIQHTLAQLDKVAMGLKVNEGVEGIQQWMEWKDKGILTDSIGNSLVKLCEISNNPWPSPCLQF